MLLRSVQSALAQTHDNIEIIVVDDGSSAPVSLARPNDRAKEILVIRNDFPSGVCAARNLGLRAATGDWIVFLDDDDELAPRMVASSLAAARLSSLTPPVAVLSTMQVMDHEGNTGQQRIPPVLPRGSGYFLSKAQKGRSWLAQNSLLAPTSVLRSIGGWDEMMGAAEHVDFYLRLNTICSIDGITEVGYLYHCHGVGHLNQNFLKTGLDMERTLRKHWAEFRSNNRLLARYSGSCGYYFLRANRWCRSVRWCVNAVWIDPTQGRLWLYLFASLAGPVARHLFRGVRRVAALMCRLPVREVGVKTT